jgi:hypothetical protein
MFTACFNDSLNESNTFDVFLEKWDGLIPYQNVCTSATDAFKFPENWTREDLDNFENLAAENFYSMSTCGLLETLLDHPTNRMLGPWCTTCSNSNLPGVTLFNNKLREDKIVTELFERNDRFSVLASKYLTIIKDKKEHSGQIAYFEMLLASDMCMTSLNESEKTMFMAMALEKVKDKSENIHIDETYHIIVAIMKSSNYEPFLNEFGTEWTESLIGYTICYVSQNEILKYAKQFLNEQK